MVVGCCSCRPSGSNLKRLSNISNILSWLASVIAVILLVIGADSNNQGGRITRQYGRSTCYVVRPERLKDTKDCWFNNKWNKVAHLLGSAQGDQEAVKECYKEYIGMVKIYYEGAQRSKQGRPREDVVKNSSGTAWIKEPQAFAKMSVEIEDTLDGTPRKKSRIARDNVNKESNKKQKQLEGLFRCRLPTISNAWRLEA
ncbi:bulb-type lectin domain-containing protein [Tanacetum coccineum]